MSFGAYDFQLDDDIFEVWEERFPDFKRPSYTILNDDGAITLEEVSYVSDDLISVLEYRLKVNKEALVRHRIEWLPYFRHYKNSFDWSLDFEPEWMLDVRLKNCIADNFKQLLLKLNDDI